MTVRMLIGAGAIAGAVVLVGQWTPRADAGSNAESGNSPDMVVSDMPDVENWGAVGDLGAYSIGTTACNVGDTILAWIDTGTFAWRHPVIAQNVYRLKDGRFEMIGMSWLKHGFCAADSTGCGACDPHGSCDWLGLGCTDTYVAFLNGFDFYLGPRDEADPVTGVAAWPHSEPVGDDTIKGRIQIRHDDLDPALNPGAVYYGEAQYLHPDDQWNEPYNNSSYRPITVGAWNFQQFLISLSGETVVGDPAIRAWAVEDPGVQLTDVYVPNDGLFIVGSRCTDNGDGTWHYEYAVFNMNSDRAGQSFSVPVPSSATITNVGFHDIDYHSGEPYDGTDWSANVGATEITWTTETFDTNPNANALRWGTTYNFRFDADVAPDAAVAVLGFFKDGPDPSIDVDICGPGMTIPGDLDNDGDVDVLDLLALLGQWGPCARCPGDLDDDGVVGILDLLLLLGNWSN